MAIDAQELVDSLRFALDAEGADHYDDDLDLIPAINLAQRWLTSLINRTLSEKKLGEEIFRDLMEARVFRLDGDSRLTLKDTGDEVWTIMALYPQPNTGASNITSNPLTLTLQEQLYHISGEDSAKRLTTEEWTYNVQNPFSAGSLSDISCAELNQYAYLTPINYKGDSSIEVRPTPPNGLVTVVYVRKPTRLVSTTTTALSLQIIEFPDTVYDLLFNKSLQYISYKQGDGTSLFSVSENDIRLLLNTII